MCLFECVACLLLCITFADPYHEAKRLSARGWEIALPGYIEAMKPSDDGSVIALGVSDTFSKDISTRETRIAIASIDGHVESILPGELNCISSVALSTTAKVVYIVGYERSDDGELSGIVRAVDTEFGRELLEVRYKQRVNGSERTGVVIYDEGRRALAWIGRMVVDLDAGQGKSTEIILHSEVNALSAVHDGAVFAFTEDRKLRRCVWSGGRLKEESSGRGLDLFNAFAESGCHPTLVEGGDHFVVGSVDGFGFVRCDDGRVTRVFADLRRPICSSALSSPNGKFVLVRTDLATLVVDFEAKAVEDRAAKITGFGRELLFDVDNRGRIIRRVW